MRREIKYEKKIDFLILTLIISLNCITWGGVSVSAHSQMLDTRYDNCVGEAGSDGKNEMWYLPYWDSECYHLDTQVMTLKYYFESTTKYGQEFEWGDYMTSTEADDVKDAFANSMKKWNNVYFYSYDSVGNVIKKKIINIVEGTINDHNLSIHPNIGDDIFAETFKTGTATYLETKYNLDTGSNISHNHYSEWQIELYVNEFVYGRNRTASEVDYFRAGVGAHEIGHILGVFDLDVEDYCRSGLQDDGHHEELLMGYGLPLDDRTSDITYKDIIGVAVARGFHTDNDHKWLYLGIQSDGTYKFICSICNGVKYATSVGEFSYDWYQTCNRSHNLTNGNMMAVASYGTKDYYKCKYCRYVASFENIVEQNYSDTLINYSDTYHTYTNNVLGLEYIVCEAHSYTDHYEKHNSAGHYAYCACADYIETAHVLMRPVGGSIGGLSICKYCGEQVSFGVLDSIPAHYPHTENGSYILPNGIIVLVPEDEEAYLNGTLEFRTGEIM